MLISLYHYESWEAFRQHCCTERGEKRTPMVNDLNDNLNITKDPWVSCQITRRFLNFTASMTYSSIRVSLKLFITGWFLFPWKLFDFLSTYFIAPGSVFIIQYVWRTTSRDWYFCPYSANLLQSWLYTGQYCATKKIAITNNSGNRFFGIIIFVDLFKCCY